MADARLRLLRPLLPALSLLTERYIAHHRSRLYPEAQPIPLETVERLAGFFSDDILRETRVIESVVPTPFFYPIVRWLDLGEFPEISAIGAITFVDLIAYPEPPDLRTLFHELVHVVQYRVLGLRAFARNYVHGFVSGGAYERIPLEQEAYELDARFTRNRNRRFSVEGEVRSRWLKER
jgi:hypothetical protein